MARNTPPEAKTDSADEPQIVLVVWADAHCGDSGWLELDAIDDDGECLVPTVGYWVRTKEHGAKANHVTLLQTLHEGEGIHPFYIPNGMVRKIVFLRNDKEIIDIRSLGL